MPTLEALIAGLQCPRCGHDDTYIIRTIERTERVDSDTVTVTLRIGECTVCGEQALDDVATHKLFDAVQKLRDGSVTQLLQTGAAYHYP